MVVVAQSVRWMLAVESLVECDGHSSHRRCDAVVVAVRHVEDTLRNHRDAQLLVLVRKERWLEVHHLVLHDDVTSLIAGLLL